MFYSGYPDLGGIGGIVRPQQGLSSSHIILIPSTARVDIAPRHNYSSHRRLLFVLKVTFRTINASTLDDCARALPPPSLIMELTFKVNTVANFAGQLASKPSSKRKASESLLEPDGVKKHKVNKGGRPRTTTVPSSKPTKAPTKLRQDRPVMARIPIDVWQTILGFCKPAFLLKARQVSSSFKTALSFDSAWKTARLRMYGRDHPDPPTGISEMQYADLLTGVGCQSRDCEGKPRRTYWAFQRRWCEPCLAQNVVSVGGLKYSWCVRKLTLS